MQAYIWPGTRGVPLDAEQIPINPKEWSYFAVKTVRDSGVVSLHARFGSDIEPPVSPLPENVHVEAVMGGVWIHIEAGDRARFDRGWRSFVVWRADGAFPSVPTDPLGVTEMVRNSGLAIFVQVDPGQAYYWQVVSVDFNENQGLLINDLAHWKVDEYTPPAPPFVQVIPEQGGWRVKWQPIVPQGGDPQRVRGYRVWRYTANPDPSDNVAIAPGGATELGVESTGTEAFFPEGTGSGFWFGVGGVSFGGNSGLARWAEDPTSPDVPVLSAYTWQPMPGGFRIIVNLAAETARLHEAFKEYVVVRPGATVFGPHEVLGAFNGTEFIYQDVNWADQWARLQFEIQLLSRLWNGRVSDPVYPRLTNSLLIRNGLPAAVPPNGTFTLVTSGGKPAFWELFVVGGVTGGTVTLTQDLTNGIVGSPCARITIPAGGTVGDGMQLSLASIYAVPYNPASLFAGQFSYKLSVAITGANFIQPALYVRFYTDDYGESYNTFGGEFGPTASALAANTWQHVRIYNHTPGAYPPNRTARLGVEIIYTRETTAEHYLYIDDVYCWEY
jgi:hypothetical protein